MALMQQPAVEAITLALGPDGTVGHFDAQTIVFDPALKHIALHPCPQPRLDEQAAIARYGTLLKATVMASPARPRRLLAIAADCIAGRYASLDDVHLALERRLSDTIYIPLIIVILLLLALLYWLNLNAAEPAPPLHVASINTQRGRAIVATPLLSLKRKFKLFV